MIGGWGSLSWLLLARRWKIQKAAKNTKSNFSPPEPVFDVTPVTSVTSVTNEDAESRMIEWWSRSHAKDAKDAKKTGKFATRNWTTGPLSCGHWSIGDPHRRGLEVVNPSAPAETLGIFEIQVVRSAVRKCR